MKTNDTNRYRPDTGSKTSFRKTCAACCRKVLAQIARVKESLFDETRGLLETQEHLLRLALNEAEAAAWETRFPHLVFPTLAMEKVEALVAWDRHQQTVRQMTAVTALAA